ncbi:MAG: hypothetical protein EZS28_045308 [Streblomastix strix]|uniref:Uncharacterized protein n=1 Tax=Streblomastix strix TaxID=222440 RepID=A0A5J4TNY4_9EUKA|nr:MAG: hypothetical protein EZS28_045308 [Streblomastix strix]
MVAFQGDITDILTTEAQPALPTGQSSIYQLFPNAQTGSVYINPVGDAQSVSYNQGIRISDSIFNAASGKCFRCDKNNITNTNEKYWSVIANDNGIVIGLYNQPLYLDQGLRISTDGQALTFNGNGFVDIAANQTITGKKTFAGVNSGNIQINTTATSYDKGLRIARSDENSGNSTIQLGCSRTSNIGSIEGQWTIFIAPNTAIGNPQCLIIAVASQASDNTRRLQMQPDGNTLTINGSVIAGTGATNGASNGSVNYSAGNTILLGVNST